MAICRDYLIFVNTLGLTKILLVQGFGMSVVAPSTRVWFQDKRYTH